MSEQKANSEACPKCKSTKGHYHWLRIYMEGEWGTFAVAVDERGPKEARCLDCGVRVSRKRAEGWGDDERAEG